MLIRALRSIWTFHISFLIRSFPIKVSDRGRLL